MGGQSKGEVAPTTSAPVAGAKPAYLKNATAAMMPAFMPGQQTALAQELAAGFGQSPTAFANFLAQVNQPAQTMNFNAQPVAPKPVIKPVVKPSPLNLKAPTTRRVPSLGKNAR